MVEYESSREFLTGSPKRKKMFSGIGKFLQLVAAGMAGSLLTFSLLAFTPLGADIEFMKTGSEASLSAQHAKIDEAQKLTALTEASADSAITIIAEKVSPSIVGIKTTAAVSDFFGNIQKSSNEGSGIIIKSNGYIMTNYHVISSAIDSTSKKIASGSKIEVYLSNQKDKPYEAVYVGGDSKTDLAVIKIDAADLTAAELGDSDKVKVGELAVAIGNPGGLELMGSVTAGIISGVDRTIKGEGNKLLKLIQTDAAINPGNSGGALLNSKGQVIGVNSVKIAAAGYEGLGFAIPINTARQIADELIANKYVTGRPLLGVSIDPRYNEQIAKLNNLPEGAYVYSVAVLSGAYKAGVKSGDIITALNGEAVKNYDDLEEKLSSHKPGETISLKIYREGNYITLRVILTEDKG